MREIRIPVPAEPKPCLYAPPPSEPDIKRAAIDACQRAGFSICYTAIQGWSLVSYLDTLQTYARNAYAKCGPDQKPEGDTE